MYINSLHIEKYKIFEDLKMEFQVPEDDKNIVNVIAGVNGSGKTTLLELIFYIFNRPNASDNFDAKIVLNDKKISDLYNNIYRLREKSYKNNEYINGIHSSPRIISIFSTMTFKYEAKNILDINYKFLNIIDIDELLGNAELFIKNYIIQQGEQSFKSNPKERREDAINSFNSVFSECKLLTKLIDLDYFDNNRPIFETLNGDRITIDKLSSGEQQLYARVVSLMILNPHNSIILIDEPEIALHPKWQIEIMKIYSNIGKNNQFIVTTHSPHIIASIENENINFLIEKDGKIVATNDVVAYGRDINWVLNEMGVDNTRPPKILKKIAKCKDFLEEDNYDEVEKCIDEIESIIGNNDREVLALRNSLEFWRE